MGNYNPVPLVGKNQQLRKRIGGQFRVIAAHQDEIAAELRQPSPDAGYIRKWKHEIDTARDLIDQLPDD